MNDELARAFERIADLLEISGGDAFRVNSYRRVSRAVAELTDDVRVLDKAGVLREVKGVGKSTAAKIQEFIKTGKLEALEELEKKVPVGLLDLLAIPGMGPKKVSLVYHELDVRGMKDLKRVIKSGDLEKLAGMGPQSVKRISEGISFLESSGGRTALGIGVVISAELCEFVSEMAGVTRVSPAGSMRRGAETVGDLDILCACADGKKIVDAFVEHRAVKKVLVAGGTKGSVVVDDGFGRDLQVDLRVVPEESFGAALQYFTGSKEHNVRLREIAVKKGLRLNEWGLFEGEECVASETEEEVYAALGLPFVPPELREDRWEFDKGAKFDDLITVEAMRGDLHMHTVASDGRNTIEELGEAARERGYEYIAITDHSRSSAIANGLSIERLLEHVEQVRKADRKVKGIKILASCECDILSDGSLDYPDDVLAQCDIVTASIHSAMKAGKVPPTERTCLAMQNKYVDIIGHPTGRLIGERPPMAIDMAKVVATAAETDTVLEVNGSWHRLDLKDLHVRQAIDAGVRISISTDAHGIPGLEQMRFGVVTARRGNARCKDVLNAQRASELLKWLKRKRS